MILTRHAIAAVLGCTALMTFPNAGLGQSNPGSILTRGVDAPTVELADASERFPAEKFGRAWDLAAQGRIDELWRWIDNAPQGAAASNQGASVEQLQEEVAAFREHQADWRERTSEAYETAMADFEKAAEEADLEEAMSAALEAHGLSPHPEEFLNYQKVREVIAEAEAAAEKADAEGDWFTALLYYRQLDVLFEDEEKYEQPLNEVARKLRLMRLYVPDAYYRAADDFAIRQGEEPSAHWESEDDDWEKELREIDLTMLRQALTLSANHHMESSSFEKLYLGGIEAVRLFLTTDVLKETFPALADEKKVGRFDDYLEREYKQIGKRDNWLTYAETTRRLNELMDVNRETVDLPEAVLIHEFADGAMNTLDDFSAMVWPADKERFERTTKQEFTGVGIQITLTDGELTVVSPLEDTPAHRAGIKAGDRIATIDGKATTGISLDQAVSAITGEEGTTVTLGIKPAGSEQIVNKTITRKTIKIISVKGFERRTGGGYDYWLDEDAGIGYIRLTQFGGDTADEMDHAYTQLRHSRAIATMRDAGVTLEDAIDIANLDPQRREARLRFEPLDAEQRQQVIDQLAEPRQLNGLVLDLRFNPGGLLTAAVEVANRFLDSGTIVSGDVGGLRDKWSAEADDKQTWDDFPVVVLINKGSASASEIVAGALQDHNRAMVLGENTYGKGSVQQLFPVSQYRAYVKVTTQYYKLPSGRIIHRRPGAERWGVKPDVEVKMTSEQVEKLLQARMAIDVLRDAEEAGQSQPDEKPEPATEEGAVEQPDTEAGDANTDAQQAPLDDAEMESLPETAHQILAEGYDPPLEMAVLLLKARLLNDVVAGR